MKFQIVSHFRVSPQLFWERLFFDADYNAGLYQALGFPDCEVRRLDKDEAGRTHRTLRVVPLIRAPLIIRKKLEDTFSYLEEGTFYPDRMQWEFRTLPSLAAEHSDIRGVISAFPEGSGMRHVLDLTCSISAFGLGSLFERAVESNTRESYRKTIVFTDEYATRLGMIS